MTLRSPGLQSTLAGIAAFALFALLRSNDFTAVDGAVRCLEVFHRNELFFHGNNHLLYPANVLLWHRFLALFGLRASTPIEYLELTQLLNSLAAAGCVAILYRLIHCATGSWRAALGGAALLAFSRAFLIHATQSAEPIAGLLWSLLAVLVLALTWPRRGLAAPFAAGALLALALATYQGMILLAPAAAVLCVAPDRRRSGARLLAAALGGLLALALLYGTVYSFQGIEGVGAKVERFFTLNSPEIFGRPSPRKVALVPLGFAADLFPLLPEGFTGVRSLLRSPATALLAGGASLALAALTAVGAAAFWRARGRLEGRERLAALCGFTALAFTLLGPAIWDPVYDKLWLQPLAAWSFLAALAAARLPGPRWRGALAAAAAAAGLVLIAANLGWAVPAHARPTPWLAEAQQVAGLAAADDLVVHEWDGISVLYGTLWGWSPERHRFDFPTTAVERGPRVREDLDQAVAAARRRGGRVWFLGVLEQPREQWEVFLGRAAGVPYEILDPYRAGARPAAAFPYKNGKVHLRVWEGPPPFAP